jgi:MFS family permease
MGFGVAVAVTGALSDTQPKARLLFYGSLILGLSFMAFYARPGFAYNLAVMALIGAGIGSYEGVTDALLFDLHTSRAGLFININHLFVTLGSGLIAVYLIFLSAQWRAATVQAGAAVLALAVVFALLRSSACPRHSARPPDCEIGSPSSSAAG